jgi:hypothetical protein
MTAGATDRRWTREHLFPRTMFEPSVSSKIVLACRGCNHARGCRLPSPDEITRAAMIYGALGDSLLFWQPRPLPTGLGTLADAWPEGPPS